MSFRAKRVEKSSEAEHYKKMIVKINVFNRIPVFERGGGMSVFPARRNPSFVAIVFAR